MSPRLSVAAKVSVGFVSISLLAALILAQHQGDTLTAQLFGSTQSATHPGYPVLGACTSEDNKLFSIAPEQIGNVTKDEGAKSAVQPDAVDVWSECYHTTVDAVIDEYMGQPVSASTLDVLNDCFGDIGDVNATPETASAVDCLSSSPQLLTKPGELFIFIASHLPPWENKKDTDELTRTDIGTVLQEYLRVYECALTERDFFRYQQAQRDLTTMYRRSNAGTIPLDVVTSEAQEEHQKIQQEIEVARPALQRVLTLLSGLDRLKPLENEVECLQRASLDIRNAFALSAEASACLPRAWDARDALRDNSDAQ